MAVYTHADDDQAIKVANQKISQEETGGLAHHKFIEAVNPSVNFVAVVTRNAFYALFFQDLVQQPASTAVSEEHEYVFEVVAAFANAVAHALGNFVRVIVQVSR